MKEESGYCQIKCLMYITEFKMEISDIQIPFSIYTYLHKLKIYYTNTKEQEKESERLFC